MSEGAGMIAPPRCRPLPVHQVYGHGCPDTDYADRAILREMERANGGGEPVGAEPPGFGVERRHAAGAPARRKELRRNRPRGAALRTAKSLSI